MGAADANPLRTTRRLSASYRSYFIPFTTVSWAITVMNLCLCHLLGFQLVSRANSQPVWGILSDDTFNCTDCVVYNMYCYCHRTACTMFLLRAF